jgi:hypothetical protein
MRERIEDKLARRPTWSPDFDRSGTSVRCADGFSRVRRECVQLDDGRWVPKHTAEQKGAARQP